MKDFDWEILHELYKNPNLTKVADLMYLTQPSLTKRLQNMEEEFGITIVNRTSKGLVFTEEGAFLAQQAQVYLDFLEDTKHKLEKIKEKKTIHIRIGSSYTYSKYVLSDILADYKSLHPEVKFDIRTDQSDILFRYVIEDKLDAAFIRGDYDGNVHRVLIGENEAYLVSKEPLTAEELLSLQKINYNTNDRTRELFDQWWHSMYHCSAVAGMEVGYIDFAWQLINKGLGYTICFLPENFQNEHNLVLTPLAELGGKKIVRRTWLYYPKSKHLPEFLETFVNYVEGVARN